MFKTNFNQQIQDISFTTSPLSNCLRSLNRAAASRILNQFPDFYSSQVKTLHETIHWNISNHLLNSMQNACTSMKSSCIYESSFQSSFDCQNRSKLLNQQLNSNLNIDDLVSDQRLKEHTDQPHQPVLHVLVLDGLTGGDAV